MCIQFNVHWTLNMGAPGAVVSETPALGEIVAAFAILGNRKQTSGRRISNRTSG